jgi:hypothetical protein
MLPSVGKGHRSYFSQRCFSPIYRQIELLNAAGALICNRDVTKSI